MASNRMPTFAEYAVDESPQSEPVPVENPVLAFSPELEQKLAEHAAATAEAAAAHNLDILKSDVARVQSFKELGKVF